MGDDGGLGLFSRFLSGLARTGLRLGARVTVSGTAGLDVRGPLIVAVNHMSNADPPFVAGWLAPALGRRPRFLAKEVLFVGPMGVFLRSQGVIPVRSGGSDVDAYRTARALLEAGEVVVIFPEGTRSWDGLLGRPMPGIALLALRTGAPVLPLGISGTDRFLGRSSRWPRLGTPITLRVGRPFVLRADPALDRRQGVAAAGEEVMRRIAALVDERHRGAWEPWPDGDT